LAVLEIALRIAKVPPLREASGDAALGFVNPPNGSDTFDFPEYGGKLTLRSNNLGFREDQDTKLSKSPGTQRIVVVGDSQTAGECANSETYPHQMELALQRENPLRQWEVLNLGTGRYSPYQYLIRTERAAFPLNPDRVIVGLYTGNDLMDLMRRDDRPYLTLKADGSVEEHPPEFVTLSPPGNRPGLLAGSRVYAVLRHAAGPTLVYQIQRASMLLRATRGHNVFSIGSYMWDVKRTVDISLGLSTQSALQSVWFRHFPETQPTALALNKWVTRRFKELCETRHISLTYALIPSKIQIEPDDFPDVLARLQHRDPTMTLGSMQAAENELTERVLQDLRDLGVPAIDLRPALKQGKAAGRMYYRDEMHLTPAGNRVVAEAIADVLRADRSSGATGN
jgi:lysophospholipase L1-like esterase